MPKPEVPIDVNASTGVWETDGLPMLYVPRHFFINNHVELEQALGRDKYAGLLFNSGFQSAYSWCEHESTRHGLTGMEVFHHYMEDCPCGAGPNLMAWVSMKQPIQARYEFPTPVLSCTTVRQPVTNVVTRLRVGFQVRSPGLGKVSGRKSISCHLNHSVPRKEMSTACSK